LFDLFTLSVVPGAPVGGMNPGRSRAERLHDARARAFDLAMMLAGFAGLGFLSYRASRKAGAAA
jgi:hypothetical protein